MSKLILLTLEINEPTRTHSAAAACATTVTCRDTKAYSLQGLTLTGFCLPDVVRFELIPCPSTARCRASQLSITSTARRGSSTLTKRFDSSCTFHQIWAKMFLENCFFFIKRTICSFSIPTNFSDFSERTSNLRFAKSSFLRRAVARSQSSVTMHPSLHRVPSRVKDLHRRHVRVGADHEGLD